jgi:hypothetical protein
MNPWPYRIGDITTHAVYRYLCRVDKVGQIAEQLLQLKGRRSQEVDVLHLLAEFGIDVEDTRRGMWDDVNTHKRLAEDYRGEGMFVIHGKYARYVVAAKTSNVVTCMELKPRHLLAQKFRRRVA